MSRFVVYLEEHENPQGQFRKQNAHICKHSNFQNAPSCLLNFVLVIPSGYPVMPSGVPTKYPLVSIKKQLKKTKIINFKNDFRVLQGPSAVGNTGIGTHICLMCADFQSFHRD